jgi:Phage integrase family
VLSDATVRRLLRDVAADAGLRDVDGSPIRFTPHDLRRIFATESVNSGLPIHIAQKLLGHLDLNTTQGYVAVYPDAVIRHYREFVANRRRSRPSGEYREPSDAEWAEFEQHFTFRKVALGNCHRPYGTPCIHEHACIRCPMLRVDPAQVPRLLTIETNTNDRLDEARQMGWRGEVVALEETLHHIGDKKQQVERATRRRAVIGNFDTLEVSDGPEP